MHRLALSISRRGPPFLPAGLSTRARPSSRTAGGSLHSLRTYATSSPKEAEASSAQSGGSRSKDTIESAGKAKGRTGGGEPLSSSENPPPRPKIHNASVPGQGRDKLTKEQQEEVDRHNADFEKKHDRASEASDDKVDKKFWSGRGGKAGQ